MEFGIFAKNHDNMWPLPLFISEAVDIVERQRELEIARSRRQTCVVFQCVYKLSQRSFEFK